MTDQHITGLIDPEWTLEDLDPATWRAIGSFIDPARYIMAGSRGEHGLFVLHDRGTVLNVADSNGVLHPSLVEHVDDPRHLAATLRSRGSWDRVHVIDRSHLANVAREAQSKPRRELTLDAYYRHVAGLIWNSGEGYACDPPREDHWNHWRYEMVQGFIADLPSPSALALGVFDERGLTIGVIVRTDAGMVRQITTFDGVALHGATPALSPDFADRLWIALKVVAPPATLLLCRQGVFDRWIEGEDKQQVIDSAIEGGEAIYRSN